MEGEQYRECRVKGLGNTDKVLVYNQKFITDNFYETEEIQGIFTLSKKNKEVKKIVDEAKNKLKTLVENQNKIETERKERKWLIIRMKELNSSSLEDLLLAQEVANETDTELDIRNIGVLMFTEHPEKLIPGVYIELIRFNTKDVRANNMHPKS